MLTKKKKKKNPNKNKKNWYGNNKINNTELKAKSIDGNEELMHHRRNNSVANHNICKFVYF